MQMIGIATVTSAPRRLSDVCPRWLVETGLPLGRQDSNLRIRNRAQLGSTAIVRRKEWQQIVHDLTFPQEGDLDECLWHSLLARRRLFQLLSTFDHPRNRNQL